MLAYVRSDWFHGKSAMEDCLDPKQAGAIFKANVTAKKNMHCGKSNRLLKLVRDKVENE